MCFFVFVFFFAFKKTVVCFRLCLFVLFVSSFSKEKERAFMAFMAFMELGKWGGGGSWEELGEGKS